MTQNELLSHSIKDVLPGGSSTIATELRETLKNIISSDVLKDEQTLLAILAAASTCKDEPLITFALRELSRRDMNPELLQEAAETAALSATLTTYSRFNHVSHKTDSKKSTFNLGLGSKAQLGKERTEVVLFSSSVISGSEPSMIAHEKSLLELNFSSEQIHSLAQIASTIKGANTLRQFYEQTSGGGCGCGSGGCGDSACDDGGCGC